MFPVQMGDWLPPRSAKLIVNNNGSMVKSENTVDLKSTAYGLSVQIRLLLPKTIQKLCLNIAENFNEG
jgi:hypothetical protein